MERNNRSLGLKSQREAEAAVRTLINYFDDDPEREGLQETPRRFVKFLQEFTNPDPFNFTVFEKENYDQMVIVQNIPFFSLCEHHLAPFHGVGHIAYIPNGKICGLSKLPRALDHFARRFQNQERITTQIADFIEAALQPLGVAVVLEARHLCVEMRGVKKHNTWTTTSHLTGVFRSEIAVRNEFFSLIKTNQHV